jgi:dihydrofolate synthase/folylpolyglutamate synthase
MDGAHNPHAAMTLRETLEELCQGRRIHLLIGMSSDKSADAVGEILGGLAVSATCTKSRHPRAMDPTKLAKTLMPYCQDVHVMSDPIDAYTYLLNAIAPTDILVVTGSLFLVGELRAALRQSHVRSRWSQARDAVMAQHSAS